MRKCRLSPTGHVSFLIIAKSDFELNLIDRMKCTGIAIRDITYSFTLSTTVFWSKPKAQCTSDPEKANMFNDYFFT